MLKGETEGALRASSLTVADSRIRLSLRHRDGLRVYSCHDTYLGGFAGTAATFSLVVVLTSEKASCLAPGYKETNSIGDKGTLTSDGERGDTVDRSELLLISGLVVAKSTSDTEEDIDGFMRVLVFPVGIMSGCFRCRGLWFGTGFVLSLGGNGSRLGGEAAATAVEEDEEDVIGLVAVTPTSHSEGE